VIFCILDDHNSGRNHNPEGNFRPFADTFAGTRGPHDVQHNPHPNTREGGLGGGRDTLRQAPHQSQRGHTLLPRSPRRARTTLGTRRRHQKKQPPPASPHGTGWQRALPAQSGPLAPAAAAPPGQRPRPKLVTEPMDPATAMGGARDGHPG
jgi:hypothetical protein